MICVSHTRHSDQDNIMQLSLRQIVYLQSTELTQHGSLQAVIPRSSQPDRITANIALDFILSADAMQSIDDMAFE